MSKQGQISLAIGIPAYSGQVTSNHTRMFLELGAVISGSTERFTFLAHLIADINPVDRARNWLLANAMALGADWLLMIDADTWVEADADADAGFQILRMISEADRMGATIVTAPVVRRVADGPANELAIYRLNAESKSISKHEARTIDWLSTLSRHLEPIDACGAACMAIHLPRVVEANAHFRFEDILSEDLEFCRQIREFFPGHAPGPIFLDPRVRTGHMSRPFPLYSKKR